MGHRVRAAIRRPGHGNLRAGQRIGGAERLRAAGLVRRCQHGADPLARHRLGDHGRRPAPCLQAPQGDQVPGRQCVRCQRGQVLFDRAVLLDDPIGIGSFFPTGTAAPGIFKGAWEFSKSFGVGKDYSQAAVDKYLAAGAVKVIDPETVEFNLAQPYAAFISDMATFMGSIVSPAYVTAHWKKPSDPQRGFMPGVTAGQRDDWMLYNASGTGPYALSTFDKATGNVVLKANPTYWGGPQAQIKPNVQSVIVRATLDQATRLLDLKSGSVDIADITTASVFDVIDKQTWLDQRKIQPIIPGVSVPGPNPWLTIYFAKMNFKIKNPDGSLTPRMALFAT